MLEDRGVGVLSVAEFSFEGIGGPWQVRAFTLEETIGGIYTAWVDLVHEDADADVFALDGASCALTISRGGVVTRTLRGLGRCASLEGWNLAGHLLASVEVVPALLFLDTGSDLRWFRDRTVPEILDQVLGAGLRRYGRELETQLRRASDSDPDRGYAPREMCAQYHESDFTFANRLMEDEGVAAYFDHGGKAEKLVLVDENGTFPKLPGESPIELISTGGLVRSFEAIESFKVRSNPTPARVIVQDHDLTRPRVPLRGEGRPYQAHSGDRARPAPLPYTAEERYDFPAGVTFTRLDPESATYRGSDVDVRTRLLFEESQARARVGSGTGDVSAFAPGLVFRLESGRPQIDGEYLLTRVIHHGTAPELVHPTDAAPAGRRYWNEFECVPFEVPYRPERTTPKPIGRLDRAIVVGPTGSDDIYTDERGYVRVRFVGNREERDADQPEEKRSAWIPVIQGWLGSGMGQRIIPRRGMEVLVGYQEGDPDRPLVLSCLPTSVNALPYDLPDEKTRTVLFRSASVPTGEPNYSELSVDDARDHEQVFFRAARDVDKQVLNDQRAEIQHDEQRVIGNDQAIHVKGARVRTVEKDETVTVQGIRTLNVDKDQSTTIGGDEARTVAGKRGTDITGNDRLVVRADRSAEVRGNDAVHVKGDRAVTVDQTLTLRQGPTVVEWSEGHVDVSAGSWIRIKHGGAEIQIAESGKVQITTNQDVEVSGKQVSISGQKVAIEGAEELTLAAGSGALKLDAEGAALTGTKVTSSGTSANEITGSLIKLQ